MRRTKVTGHLFLGVLFFVMPNIEAEELSADPIEELKNCARTSDSTVRIGCYEALGKRVLGEEAISVEASGGDVPTITEYESAVADVAPVSAEPARLPEKIGGGEFEEKKTKTEFEPVRGHVRSCREASDGRWFFVFDSGQVWKQSSGGKHRFRNCDFDVTITKDLFSYKMKIDDGRTLRVRRRK